MSECVFGNLDDDIKSSSVTLLCRRLAPTRDMGQNYFLPGVPYSRRMGDGSISIPERTFPAKIWDMARPAKRARIIQETLLGKVFEGEEEAIFCLQGLSYTSVL